MHHLSRRAEEILRLAKHIARGYGQGFVGTEHLLLAILREGEGQGALLLRAYGATEESVKEHVDQVVQDRMQETWVLGRLPGTPHFRDVLSRAAHEARGRGNWQICSVHLLLAILEEKNSTGWTVLQSIGITTEDVRKRIVRETASA
jgi:ATP-dependent Clp protease ATP-binding subunit ClpC